jgi:hypothetical protein
LIERIGALELNVDATNAQLRATQTQLKDTRTELNAQLSLVQDPRLSYFSAAMSGSRGSRHSAASKQIKEAYGRVCLFCGSNEGVTLAHLVAGNPVVNYGVFGPPKYVDPFDYRSARNFIFLCGTSGQKGTCHNEYDSYLIGMVPLPLGGGANQCQLICLRPDFEKYKELNNKTILMREPHPYRRILTWRNRKCLLEHGGLCSGGVIQNALRACDLSEMANSVSNDDSNSDDADSDSTHIDNADSDYVDPDYVDGMPVKSV